VILAT